MIKSEEPYMESLTSSPLLTGATPMTFHPVREGHVRSRGKENRGGRFGALQPCCAYHGKTFKLMNFCFISCWLQKLGGGKK